MNSPANIYLSLDPSVSEPTQAVIKTASTMAADIVSNILRRIDDEKLVTPKDIEKEVDLALSSFVASFLCGLTVRAMESDLETPISITRDNARRTAMRVLQSALFHTLASIYANAEVLQLRRAGASHDDIVEALRSDKMIDGQQTFILESIKPRGTTQ